MIVNIICRDCTKPCQTIYHVIGLQCLNCLGFNTIRSDDKLYTRVNDERKFGFYVFFVFKTEFLTKKPLLLLILVTEMI